MNWLGIPGAQSTLAVICRYSELEGRLKLPEITRVDGFDRLGHGGAHKCGIHLSLLRLEHPALELCIPDLPFEHLMNMVSRALPTHGLKEVRRNEQASWLHRWSCKSALIEVNVQPAACLLQILTRWSDPQKTLQRVLDREIAPHPENGKADLSSP